MSADKRARLKQWLASGEARLQPLSFPQRELWEASPVAVGDMANHICAFIEVRGLLTEKDSHAAIQAVVNRQEALRLSIIPGKDQPLQMVRSTFEANLSFRDLAGAERTPEGIETIAKQIFAEPFDLLQGPLYRAVILRKAADECVIVLAIHHAIADGWTLGVFVQDLFGAYMAQLMGATEPLPAVPLTYTGWGAAERGFWTPAILEPRLDFWRKELAGRPRLWSTPAQPGWTSGAAERWVTSISADLARATRDLARRHSATLYSTLLAAFQTAFSKWAGTNDVLVGSPIANRSKDVVHETMGYFAGIVPVRGQVDGARPFSAMLRHLQETTAHAFAEAVPFAELARALGEQAAPGCNPIFEVRFALQNHPMHDITLPNLGAKLRMRSTGTARYDIACEVTEQGDNFEVVWLVRHARFAMADLHELDRLFQSVLAAASRSPESRTDALLP
jgi:hypothetical protein